jgi:hypothetical protein
MMPNWMREFYLDFFGGLTRTKQSFRDLHYMFVGDLELKNRPKSTPIEIWWHFLNQYKNWD